MDLIISIPASFTKVEEDIQIKKLMEKKNRSSATLSDFMLVVRETPDIKRYDPTADVQMWVAEGLKTVRENVEAHDEKESTSSDWSDVCIVEDSDDEDKKKTKKKKSQKSGGKSSKNNSKLNNMLYLFE